MALQPLLMPPVDDDADDDGIVVDLEGGALEGPEPQIEYAEDGSIVVDFEPVEPEEGPGMFDEYVNHNANLAEYLSPTELAGIGSTILELVDDDLESRSDWVAKMEGGLSKLGVIEDPKTNEPFEGASRVRHPLLAEACVQFQARAIKELFPPKGPVKARVLGEANEEAEERRERVEGYMNYQYTTEMPEAFDAMDQMLMYLPLSGSAFKKAYPDPRLGRLAVPFVRAEDLIVPYSAVDLESAPRHTHRIRRYRNDMLKLMRSGFYRQVDLPMGGRAPEADPLREVIAKAEGRDDVLNTRDDEYEILECNIEYDLPGFEDADERGEPTGIALPYIITVERETRQVLSVYRNWKADDPGKRKRVWFTHYKYLPGFGFYGYGLLHMIGGLADAATGALRALMDSAAFANMQGGFRRKTKGSKAGTTAIAPGQWEDVEVAGENIRDMFMPLPYKEPSSVLFNLLGFLVEASQRFSSTTESMVGDANNTGPVGTTLALIEQGSKVFSSIHKRLHRAQNNEFKLVKELNAETLEGPYPYQVEGEDRVIMPEDFAQIDVEPVSDPNIYSNTQRIAQAQAGLQLAESAPDLHDRHEAYRRMYQAMEIDPDGLLVDPNDIPRMDPLTENMALMHSKAIKVYNDQAHEAHMAVHQSWFTSLPPEGQKMLQGAFMAHMGEHMAYAYRARILAGMGGANLPLPDLRGTGPITYDEGQELPPQMENQIATAIAMALQQNPMLNPPAPPQEGEQAPEDMKAMADIKRRDQAHIADQKRKDQAAVADIKRKDIKASADLEAFDAKTAQGMLADQVKAEAAAAAKAAEPKPALMKNAPGGN